MVWAVFRTFRWVYHYDRECCRSGNGHISFVGKDAEIQFVGTNAWFFLVINYLKIPVQMFAWNNITSQSLIIDALTIPFILMGGVTWHLFSKTITGKGLPQFYKRLSPVCL